MWFEAAHIAIGAGRVEKSVANRGGLLVGFPLGDVKGVRGTGIGGLIGGVGYDGGHVPSRVHGGLLSVFPTASGFVLYVRLVFALFSLCKENRMT